MLGINIAEGSEPGTSARFRHPARPLYGDWRVVPPYGGEAWEGMGHPLARVPGYRSPCASVHPIPPTAKAVGFLGGFL